LIYLLHHSIAEAARREPDRDAFRIEGQGITYGELEERSNQLAEFLVARGVRRMDRVGIYLQKSLELPIALFGILKAGGVYVPIDPQSPKKRLDFIVRDCGLRHLVTQPEKARVVRPVVDQNSELGCVVGIDPAAADTSGRYVSWAEVASEPGRDPDVASSEQDLAYIMYTSGSTGAPKGLMHTHASGLAYARMSARVYDVAPTDRLGNHAPLHFDMSTFEYLTSPLVGSTTVMVPEEVMMFPVELGRLIEREQLTHWYSVPLALVQMLYQGEVEERDFSALRWILTGGEPFPPAALWRLMDLWPNVTFSNVYGPAEVNQCTYFHVPRELHGSTEPIPIGAVWPGADGLIVDGDDREVDPGETGELLISAPTMMRGYWNRPDLTAPAFFRRERFPGFEEVYYRTGDLVREAADGVMEFLGRKDRQIKVRGFRVELDEVENVLNGVDDVLEGAAISLKNDQGQSEIHAAVLLIDSAEEDANTLRRRAAESLPSYAVPDRVWVRESLPRTGSGKIDRRKLEEEIAEAAAGLS